MNASATPLLSAKARALRETFDAAFASPPPPPPPEQTALLLLRVGGERIAVKRSEITGLIRAENFVPAPGRLPAFLGLAGVRGELYPVWSLAALLGRAETVGAAGWFVLAATREAEPCAFVCDAFERLIFMDEVRLVVPAPELRRGLVQALVPWDAALAPVVDLPALLEEIHQRRESLQPNTLS